MADLILYVSLLIIWLSLLYHLFLMVGGYCYYWQHFRIVHQWQKKSLQKPVVSILIPAHNEEVVIRDTLSAMVKLNYPKDKLEIIVINDLSTDQTGAIVDEFSKEYSFVKAVHTEKPFGGKGKSGALNQGLKNSQGEVIVVYDADNQPEPNALHYLVMGLINDQSAGAVVGKFRVLNAKKNLLTRFINIETLTFQWLAQAGRWYWFKVATIPGTNFAIRRSLLEELDGWDEKALSEDTELSFRVYESGYHIRFFPQGVTWEQEPETLKVWWKQRTRWARGNLYVIGKYLFRVTELKSKRVMLDLLYFISIYLLFFAGILLSHSLFVTSFVVDLNLTIGSVSFLLIFIGFLVFVTQVCLALSLEQNQLTSKNVMTVALMYVIYSQMWIFLVIYASGLEIKRVMFKQEARWYKTERFDSKSKGQKEID